MKVTTKVKQILSHYESDNPGTKTNLAKILMAGKLSGTGSLVILPVDQGFEHGPERSFAKNINAYDPHYHFKLAIEAELSAYAAPLGMLEAGADTFAGEIPLILKLNSSNSLSDKSNPDQAITARVRDAVRLGCSAIGLTLYPSANKYIEMIEEAKELIAEAKSYGLVTVVWSYPRGGALSKDGETAIDTISYGAHMAALIGAHIIKVKPPKAYIEQLEAKKVFESEGIKIDTLKDRIALVKRSCFNGRRLVVFSGGENKNTDDIYREIKEICNGGGDGSIIGRNTFQRPYDDALTMLNDIINIYKKP